MHVNAQPTQRVEAVWQDTSGCTPSHSGGWRQVFETLGQWSVFEEKWQTCSLGNVLSVFCFSIRLRLTGKACNLQLIRDMAHTNMINSGASVEVMESFSRNIISLSKQGIRTCTWKSA
ncbi:MAG: hypothetical protein ICV61_13525 [Microcoleus sp. Co-bin12]|nr:hypothetical protein [Microcoleus sp. Co-bin12]